MTEVVYLGPGPRDEDLAKEGRPDYEGRAVREARHQIAASIRNDRLAFALTGLSIVLVGVMAYKEVWDLFGTTKFDQDEANRRGR